MYGDLGGKKQTKRRALHCFGSFLRIGQKWTEVNSSCEEDGENGEPNSNFDTEENTLGFTAGRITADYSGSELASHWLLDKSSPQWANHSKP